MRHIRNVLDALRRPTVVSAVVALAVATVLVVTQSDHGSKDVGMGIWWYEYYPFYSYSHGDFVRYPPTLPIYANLALVSMIVYVPVRILESGLADAFDVVLPALDAKRSAITAGLAIALGLVSLTESVTLLDLLTILLGSVVELTGVYAYVERASFEMGAGSTTPAAALALCVLYGAIQAGQHGVRWCRSVFRTGER